ncbi:MAG: YraN family protein [Bacteroidetes bacterium]|nr:YraN family protein [Bacteroidota bacterium]
MAAHNETGKKGEDIAAGFMEAKGYIILDRNYRFERAEIDLVALRFEPAVLVFIEVKTRTNTRDSYPEESIGPKKKKRIFKVADSYIYEKRMTRVPIRFDIISIGMDNPGHPMIYHIEDAFRLDGPFL